MTEVNNVYDKCHEKGPFYHKFKLGNVNKWLTPIINENCAYLSSFPQLAISSSDHNSGK